MDNLEVLTNYMQRDEMRDTSGNVRSIILSEIGYSSTSGETMQAAAFAYAYTKMEKNGYIDALMLSRQTDASDEIAALGLALGLQTTGGHHKYIYNVFKYIDTDKRNEVVSFAYDIVGTKF
jgi:pyruvoyl-dependent arginine decarboxylase (PvlArgDC)